MIILGKPNNIDDYICVTSEQSKKLHKLGFIPIYREIGVDKIYYLKTEKICKILGKEETPQK